MYFTVKELELRRIEFNDSFSPGVIELIPDVQQVKPLKAKGYAELIREHGGQAGVIEDIRVVGDLSTELEAPCSRCVEPVRVPVKSSFDLLYRPLKTVDTAEDVSISEEETEIGYFTGDGVMLEDVLKEQVLLSLPIKMVCREDCKGLCPQCGQNLNNGSCDCSPKISDPRWAALEGLRDKIK